MKVWLPTVWVNSNCVPEVSESMPSLERGASEASTGDEMQIAGDLRGMMLLSASLQTPTSFVLHMKENEDAIGSLLGSAVLFVPLALSPRYDVTTRLTGRSKPIVYLSIRWPIYC